jgi:hypothetical protein
VVIDVDDPQKSSDVKFTASTSEISGEGILEADAGRGADQASERCGTLGWDI